MSSKETASRAVWGLTARWSQMPSGDTIVLVEGMMGETLKFFH